MEYCYAFGFLGTWRSLPWEMLKRTVCSLFPQIQHFLVSIPTTHDNMQIEISGQVCHRCRFIGALWAWNRPMRHNSCVNESPFDGLSSRDTSDALWRRMICYVSMFLPFLFLGLSKFLVLRTLNGISVHIALPCVMMGSLSGSFPSQQSSSTQRHPASRTCAISRMTCVTVKCIVATNVTCALIIQ